MVLGDLTGDAVFNHRCQALRGGCRTLLAWGQHWESFLHFEASRLPFRPWTAMEEGIQLVRGPRLLDWIYRESTLPGEPKRPAPEDVRFTQGLQRRLLTAAPSELRLCWSACWSRACGAGGRDGDPDHGRRRPALAPEPAWPRQAHAGPRPDTLGPHGLAAEPRRAQGAGGQEAHQGPAGAVHRRTGAAAAAAAATPPPGGGGAAPASPGLRPGPRGEPPLPPLGHGEAPVPGVQLVLGAGEGG